MTILFLVFWWWIPPDRPDINHAFNAFVCNYADTVCRDKTSVLPVAWSRYAPIDIMLASKYGRRVDQ